MVLLLNRALPCCAGLLIPSLFVHAEHEEPNDERSCSEEAEASNGAVSDKVGEALDGLKAKAKSK